MVAEDVGAKRKIEQLLSDREETLQEVKNTIQGMYFLFFFFVEIVYFILFFIKKNTLCWSKKKKFHPVLLWCFFLSFFFFFPQGDWIWTGLTRSLVSFSPQNN